MHKYEVSKIGEFHINHNEDSKAIVEISETKILIAVMDGCSMGKESHFASTLISKLLRKIGKEISFREFIEKATKNTKCYLDEILERLFADLNHLKNQLYLEKEEILSTLILGILDISKKEIDLIILGDGVICCNGKIYEYEQNDKPDYLGYHLNEEFSTWYQSQTQLLSLNNIEDISISTDGIFTFKNFDGKVHQQIKENEIIEYLLIDEKWSSQENMLGKKIMEIEKKYGLKPSDDLTIVRMRLSKKTL